MDFIRKAAQAASEEFKETSEKVWERMGDTQGVPEELKKMGKTLGKYALTAQLGMMFNFPDDADLFRDSFNIIGDGPTGANEFTGTMHTILINASNIAQQINEEATNAQGFADISSTSTLSDITKLLPQLMASKKKIDITKMRGKADGSTKLL